ncbi:hypothetical protein [Streptomyces sp. enrichment culture]|uniref:hypothetical protein n=1 Tax=Streptomyces sp. enrichment culture TaxID=1795815 RepID=UPI003F54FF51
MPSSAQHRSAEPLVTTGAEGMVEALAATRGGTPRDWSPPGRSEVGSRPPADGSPTTPSLLP